ncbi:MAG: dihydrofolate reductase [Pseudomonadales bacterium]|nr:dihydrofolate reductase [Pseudomonadales bacterium]
MRLALIVAMAENRVIGINNNLPWHLSNDLRYFKAITMGKPVILGRKTHQSIGKPLPGRTNIVISTDAGADFEGCSVVSSVEEALELAENIALIDGSSEAIVMGGAQIYELCLPFVDRIYLTEVHAHVRGDTYFPKFDRSEWQEVGREDFDPEGDNPYEYSFVVLDRLR